MENLSNLEKDQIAARLYLESWQMDECPNHPLDRNYIGDAQVKANAERQVNIERQLLEMGYPSNRKVAYDNEGCPIIEWKDPSFNCEEYYAEIGSEDEE